MSNQSTVRTALLASIFTVVAGGVCPELVRAEAPSHSADSSADAPTATLDEIIVTARRREENAQTVPISMTVLSQQTLQDNNIQTLSELQAIVPSMTVSSLLSRDALTISIRGQGASATNNIGRPGVMVYYNEVPLPILDQNEVIGGPGLFFDLENIQVLKGPQGTLFGRSAVGGAVLLQPAKPKDELDGSIQLGYGNYNNREINGMLNAPIIPEVLLLRIAFSGQKQDGFTHVIAAPGYPNGYDADGRDNWAVRSSVSFRPSERFKDEFSATYQSYNSHPSAFFITAASPLGYFTSLYPQYLALAAEQQALGPRTHIAVDGLNESSGSNLLIDNITRVALTDDVTFRNIFGYAKAIAHRGIDIDGSDLPLLHTHQGLEMTPHEYSEEAQVLGKAFNSRLDWVAGLYYSDQPVPDQFWESTNTIAGGVNDEFRKSGNQSKAVYAQATYDLSALTNGLSFTAGVRETRDTYTNSFFSGTIADASIQSGSTKAFTWTVGANYQVAPETLLYITSRRGYRAGGSNGVVFTTGRPLPSFGPEFVTDVELGVKSDWLLGDRPVRTNVAIYHQSYSDILGTQTFVDPNTALPYLYLANGGGASVWGAEFEALIKLTENLHLGANFDYINFKYSAFGPGIDAATFEVDRTSNRPPRKYGVNAQYRLPLPSMLGDITARTNWSWQADSGNPASAIYGFVPAYGLLGASMNWDHIGGHPLEVSLYGSNLTDRVYRVGGQGLVAALGFDVYRYGEPRMYGVRATYRFGAVRK